MIRGTPTALRIGLTNVTGLGASQLVSSLLPALEGTPGLRVEQLFLPESGELASYCPRSERVRVTRWHRTLPKPLSRIVECTLLGGRFDGVSPLLVLGDLPVRTRSRQIVFVQTPHLLPPPVGNSALRYAVARAIFRANIEHVDGIIVQTAAMRDALLTAYRLSPGQVHIVAQPPPDWLLESGRRRTGRLDPTNAPLRLVYPAAGYPHKNHQLLAGATQSEWTELVAELQLTIPVDAHPQPGSGWIRCVGRLQPAAMIEAYSRADALVFLSKAESFGLPLVEAMWLGLPIIAPDLPYARALCGETAIYFDPDRSDSALDAVRALRARIDAGWWPDWSAELAKIPRDWNEVAEKIGDIVRG